MRALYVFVRVFAQQYWPPVVLLVALLFLSTSTRADIARLIEPDVLVEQARRLYGDQAQRSVQKWGRLLETSRGMAERAQLTVVNHFWNSSVQQGEDVNVWNQTDFWATPLDTLGKGIGDCEDFVIGKYFSLISLGVPPEKLRFIYVRAQVDGATIAHMVLGYYDTPQSEPLVLDSLIDAIKPARQRGDLTPVFSFNVQGIYAPDAKLGDVEQIGRWQLLMQNMQRQGFNP